MTRSSFNLVMENKRDFFCCVDPDQSCCQLILPEKAATPVLRVE